MEMNGRYYRKTAALVGALFITATVTAIVGMALLGTSLDGPDYLVGLADKENLVIGAVILELVLAVSLIAIGGLMFPVLKRHGEGLALGYAAIRLVEAVFIIVGTTCLLAMLTMGEGYSSGDLDLAGSEAMGALLMGVREWAFVIGTLVFLGLGAITLNYLLCRARLVPRWLAVWGLIGGVGVLAYGVISLLNQDMDSFSAVNLLAMPIAVEEMVFAGYLIIKGFIPPAEQQ
jgi:hypothetical protein